MCDRKTWSCKLNVLHQSTETDKETERNIKEKKEKKKEEERKSKKANKIRRNLVRESKQLIWLINKLIIMSDFSMTCIIS